VRLPAAVATTTTAIFCTKPKLVHQVPVQVHSTKRNRSAELASAYPLHPLGSSDRGGEQVWSALPRISLAAALANSVLSCFSR
jgi:hypothetical protein